MHPMTDRNYSILGVAKPERAARAMAAVLDVETLAVSLEGAYSLSRGSYINSSSSLHP